MLTSKVERFAGNKAMVGHEAEAEHDVMAELMAKAELAAERSKVEEQHEAEAEPPLFGGEATAAAAVGIFEGKFSSAAEPPTEAALPTEAEAEPPLLNGDAAAATVVGKLEGKSSGEFLYDKKQHEAEAEHEVEQSKVENQRLMKLVAHARGGCSSAPARRHPPSHEAAQRACRHQALFRRRRQLQRQVRARAESTVAAQHRRHQVLSRRRHQLRQQFCV